MLTANWFIILTLYNPGLRTHIISTELPASIPAALRPQLQNRSMQVRRLSIFPIEAIVRGYITGTAWKEYQSRGTVHGMEMPKGLQESQAFPDGPIYTPSTKAEAGANDENIHPDQAVKIVGENYARRIAELAVRLYKTGRDYAMERGIIIADTKFEFGLDKATDELVLVDEVLTPDSSRFWPKDSYRVNSTPESLDKQFVRDWLTANGKKGSQGVTLPDDVVERTGDKYKEAFKSLMGTSWEVALAQSPKT
ncbi:MAG: Bifunctional purine biosynthetic protein ade1 [Thelocarpon impressellum]|nr:MAG: Bifunctional purine biosynthetic protein ade1 [Thelocarpon impressellum]